MRIIPNPDKEFYKEVSAAIKANGGYCCCALERGEDQKCMCKDFREQEEPGCCGCGRYIKMEE